MFSRKEAEKAEHYNRANELCSKEQYSDALEEINKALDIDREKSSYYYLKGQILEALGKIEESLNAYTYASMYDAKNATYDFHIKRLRSILIEKQGSWMKYMGGHGNFPKSCEVHIKLTGNTIEIPELKLNIPYDKINAVNIKTEKEVMDLVYNFALIGIWAFAGNYEHNYLLLRYTDEVPMEQTLVFDGNDVLDLQPMIYKKIVEAKKGKS